MIVRVLVEAFVVYLALMNANGVHVWVNENAEDRLDARRSSNPIELFINFIMNDLIWINLEVQVYVLALNE